MKYIKLFEIFYLDSSYNYISYDDILRFIEDCKKSEFIEEYKNRSFDDLGKDIYFSTDEINYISKLGIDLRKTTLKRRPSIFYFYNEYKGTDLEIRFSLKKYNDDYYSIGIYYGGILRQRFINLKIDQLSNLIKFLKFAINYK